ncbi:MAG: DUF3450 domain-containing protein [Pseudomonadales bacterium]|nr:DUF3450 domain-containing protein [Pseudomonadales bacterium]
MIHCSNAKGIESRFVHSVFLSFLVFFSPQAFAAELLDETKEAVQEWIRLEQLISQENRQWREEKSSIEDLLSILDTERRILEEQIEQAQQTASRADEERAALVEQLTAYQEISASLQSEVSNYERQLLVLQPRLPLVLQRELSPRFSLLGSENQTSTRSLSERLQAVLGILSEIEAFDSTIVLTTEAIEVDPGREVEVQVLYLGLSRAFYTNGSGTIAGIGVPDEFGWEWQREDDMASAILIAVEVYESRISPRLIELPMQVRQ